MIHKIQNFYLQRNEDESGISGTGVVAVGVILPSGTCVMEWTSFHSSITMFKNVADVEAIHGHHGKTIVVMGDTPAAKKVRKNKKSEDSNGKG